VKLSTLISIATKEIKNNKKFALFFILNIAIGLSGFVLLDLFKDSLTSTLNSKSKSILAADLEVGARRPLSDEEIQITTDFLKPYTLEATRTIETYTMLASPTSSRLVELKAIENGFPFYGEIELSNNRIIRSSDAKEIIGAAKAWLYPETLLQLNLKIGDVIQLGGIDFTIADTIIRDAGSVGSGFSFALPVYVGLDQLKRTGLLGSQSTGYHSILYKIREDVDLKAISAELFKQYTDPAVRVSTHHNASQQIGRALNQLNDYLGLASLVALFLTALGTTFLYRTFLSQRFQDIAIFKSIGVTSLQIEAIYLIQILLLGFLASLPLLLFASVSAPYLSDVAQATMQLDLVVDFNLKTVLIVIFSSTLGSLFICYPLILKVRSIQPKTLLQGGEFQSQGFNFKSLLAYIPAVASYWLLAVWLSNSYRTSSLFLGSFLLALVVILLCGQFLLVVLEKNLNRSFLKLGVLLRLSLRHVTRQKFSSLSVFLALSIGLMIMNLIPQIQMTLKQEIEQPSGVKIPSLFLFDIQDEQIETLKQITKQNNAELLYVSPMIRARLDQVNGEPFARVDKNEEAFTREEENENRFRNRGFNLTYRDRLADSESIIEGEDYPGVFDPTKQELPFISLEQRFADRLKLKIGDKLTFDVQGVMVDGVVKNLRRVRWTSFQPNFFVQFQTGVLEEAPKSYLAGLPNVSPEAKSSIERSIVKDLPTVSIIEVSKVIERMSGILSQMSVALQAMAFLSVIVGLMILFSIANQQAHQRRKQVNLLKVMGASFRQILILFFYEFSSIALLASALGVALSLLMAWGLSFYIFESAPVFNYTVPLITVGITLVLTLAVTWLAIYRVLQAKPRELLQS
jgi:putative ABC transport system permease protein